MSTTEEDNMNNNEIPTTNQTNLQFLLLLPKYVVIKFIQELHYMEQFFISLHNLYAFTSQIIFFILTDWMIDGIPGEIDTKLRNKSIILALTTILFYTVFSYFVKKVKDIWDKANRGSFSRIFRTGHYFKLLCRIIVEWLKTIVVVICIREQGIHYNPSHTYSLLTMLYYLSTDNMLLQIISNAVEALSIENFENLEHLYVPLVLNMYTLGVGLLATAYLLTITSTNFIYLSAYFLVYLRFKDLYFNIWNTIQAEKHIYASFRSALPQEITVWNDICAVCLNNMSKAKITPCKHFFHPQCLKRCLKNSFACPLCKHDFAGEEYARVYDRNNQQYDE